MELQLKEYDRRPFGVTAVEVTLTNIEQVADWCKGKLDKETTRLQGMNTNIELPVIRLKGVGRDKERTFTAMVGCFVVNHKGNFRVYKPAQFREMFVEKKKPNYRAINTPDMAVTHTEVDGHTPTFTAVDEHTAIYES